MSAYLASLIIPPSEIRFEFSRSGGPGGQNVNKVSTKVRLFFDFLNSKTLREIDKAVLSRSPNITKLQNEDGEIVIVAQNERTQWTNREDAVSKLHTILRAALKPKIKRVKTKAPASVKRKRLQGKKIRGEIKAGRKRPTRE